MEHDLMTYRFRIPYLAYVYATHARLRRRERKALSPPAGEQIAHSFHFKDKTRIVHGLDNEIRRVHLVTRHGELRHVCDEYYDRLGVCLSQLTRGFHPVPARQFYIQEHKIERRRLLPEKAFRVAEHRNDHFGLPLTEIPSYERDQFVRLALIILDHRYTIHGSPFPECRIRSVFIVPSHFFIITHLRENIKRYHANLSATKTHPQLGVRKASGAKELKLNFPRDVADMRALFSRDSGGATITESAAKPKRTRSER